MGSQLISKDILATKNYDVLQQRVAGTMTLIKKIRN